MRLWILSDLHMEQCHWSLPSDMAGGADIAVLAGDVHTPLTRSIEWLAAQRDTGAFHGMEIVMVAGNHEFYHAEMRTERSWAAALARQHGIHYLDRSSVVLGGVRFVGCTLWTDYKLYGDAARAMAVAGRSLNDHALIEVGRRTFSPQHALEEHRADCRWLREVMAEPFDGPTVVVTHHGVSLQSVDPKYADDLLTPAFSSHLDDLVADSGAVLWVHGHTHDSFDYAIGTTRVLCNPKGYGPGRSSARHENSAFDPRLVVTLTP